MEVFLLSMINGFSLRYGYFLIMNEILVKVWIFSYYAKNQHKYAYMVYNDPQGYVAHISIPFFAKAKARTFVFNYEFVFHIILINI